MKTLRKGNPNKRVASENEIMKVLCNHCNARLEVVPKDFESKGGFIRKKKYFFICPECHLRTYINPEDLQDCFRSKVDEEIANRNFWS